MNRIVHLTILLITIVAILGVVGGSALADDQVTLEVHVVDDDGNDIGGATVTISWDDGEAAAETASNGKAFVDVPVDKTIDITVEHDDYVQNNPYEYGTISDHSEVTIEVFEPADATATVSENDSPIEDATVTFTKSGDVRSAAVVATDVDGTATATALEVGTYDVTVEKPGYYVETTDIDLETSEDVTIGIESGSVSVGFVIVDGVTEDQLAADLRLEKGGQHDSTLSTDANRERSLTLDVNTRYTVVIERDGYDTTEETLALGETDDNVTYEIVRTPELIVEAFNERVLVGERTSVEVIDEYDEPVEGADILLDGSVVASTDSEGAANFTIDERGNLDIVAEADGVTSAAVVIEGVRSDDDEDPAVDDDTTTDAADETESGADDDDSMPGFSITAVMLGILGTIVLAFRHRRHG